MSSADSGVVAIIAARGASKAFPGKNLASLGGKPLLAWTIEAALGAQSVSRTLVTTEDPDIAAVARRFGADVPFMRPADLSADDTPCTDAVLHAVEWLEGHDNYRPEIVTLLQPTSPLRTSADIDAALALMRDRAADGVVSVYPADPHPFWTKTLDADGWMRDMFPESGPIAQRQQLPPVYALNGALYAARRDILVSNRNWYTARTAAYVMPVERSIDIDTAFDLTVAAALLEKARLA